MVVVAALASALPKSRPKGFGPVSGQRGGEGVGEV